jgi:hypothetical protein
LEHEQGLLHSVGSLWLLGWLLGLSELGLGGYLWELGQEGSLLLLLRLGCHLESEKILEEGCLVFN